MTTPKPVRLTVIDGRQKRPPRNEAGDPITCPTCNSRASMVVTLGALRRKGRVTGGTKILVCANCHQNGVHTPLT